MKKATAIQCVPITISTQNVLTLHQTCKLMHKCLRQQWFYKLYEANKEILGNVIN